jgi:hypothetical protein
MEISAHPHSVVFEIEEFLAQVALATRFTECEVCEVEVSQDVNAVTATDFANLWQRLAAAAQLHLLQVSSLVEGPRKGAFEFAIGEMMCLLQEVKSGGSPCLDASGAIVFGSISGRRKSSRLALDMQVEITSKHVNRTCRVRDISPNGIGLVEIDGLAPDDEVSIAFGVGKSALRGTVIWARDNQAGIKLCDDLPVLDPILDWAASWDTRL